MNTASLENCKRLHKLSGWSDYHDKYWTTYKTDVPQVGSYHLVENDVNYKIICPAYALGDLLRKLEGFDVQLEYSNAFRKWSCFAYKQRGASDNPEDAACLLIIQLFEEGILKS